MNRRRLAPKHRSCRHTRRCTLRSHLLPTPNKLRMRPSSRKAPKRNRCPHFRAATADVDTRSAEVAHPEDQLTQPKIHFSKVLTSLTTPLCPRRHAALGLGVASIAVHHPVAPAHRRVFFGAKRRGIDERFVDAWFHLGQDHGPGKHRNNEGKKRGFEEVRHEPNVLDFENFSSPHPIALHSTLCREALQNCTQVRRIEWLDHHVVHARFKGLHAGVRLGIRREPHKGMWPHALDGCFQSRAASNPSRPGM